MPIAQKARNETTISGEHQVTIPAAPFREAGLKPGDSLKVEADGVGRVVLTRVDEVIDRHSGCLGTDGALRERLDGLRDEWR